MMKISRMQNKQREEGAAVMIYDFKNFKKKNLGQEVLTEERNTIIEIDVRRDPALPETMQKIYESLLNVALEEYCTISNVGYSKVLKEVECRLFVAAIDKDGKVYGEDGNIVYYMGQFCRKTGELYGQCEPLDAWIVKWRHLK